MLAIIVCVVLISLHEHYLTWSQVLCDVRNHRRRIPWAHTNVIRVDVNLKSYIEFSHMRWVALFLNCLPPLSSCCYAPAPCSIDLPMFISAFVTEIIAILGAMELTSKTAFRFLSITLKTNFMWQLAGSSMAMCFWGYGRNTSLVLETCLCPRKNLPISSERYSLTCLLKHTAAPQREALAERWSGRQE